MPSSKSYNLLEWYCSASLLTAPHPQLQLPILSSPINFILLDFLPKRKIWWYFLVLTTKQFPKSLNLSYDLSCSPQFRGRGVVKHNRREVCKWKANKNYLFLDISNQLSVGCWVDGSGSHFHGDQLDCAVVREMIFDGEEISLERTWAVLLVPWDSPRQSRRHPRALQWVVNSREIVRNGKQQNGKQIELPAESEVTAYSNFVIQSVSGMAEVWRGRWSMEILFYGVSFNSNTYLYFITLHNHIYSYSINKYIFVVVVAIIHIA